MQKIINIFTLFLLSMLMLYSGAANAQGMTEEELSMQRLQDKINVLEKSMATMQQELYRNGKSVKKNVSDAPAGDDEERARIMNGKFEEVEHHITVLATKLDKIIADIDFRLTALEKTVSANAAAAAVQNAPADATPAAKNEADIAAPAGAVPTTNNVAVTAPEKTDDKKASATPAATPAQKPKTDVATQYDKAFELLRLSKYEEAEKAFKDFIAKNKGNALLSNAYYWLGETYLSREDNQQAAVQFLKGYQELPKGNKAPDSLFKLAVSLRGLQKEKEACATLDKLKKEYPKMDKDLLTKTNAERKGLKCKAPE